MSFEFFPPRTSRMEETLWQSIDRLSILKPKFVSVTYGANSGEARSHHSIIKGIKERTGLEAAPHLTFIDASPAAAARHRGRYWNSGIRHIGAAAAICRRAAAAGIHVRGRSGGAAERRGRLRHFRRRLRECTGRKAQADLINLEAQDRRRRQPAITQFFFDVESYLRFRDRCVTAGIDVEIVPGILPVSNFKQLQRFATMTNVRVPSWMTNMFRRAGRRCGDPQNGRRQHRHGHGEDPQPRRRERFPLLYAEPRGNELRHLPRWACARWPPP